MLSRKTIDVLYLLQRSNAMLANQELPQAFRKGVASMISDILDKTGNNKGYAYLNPSQPIEEGAETWVQTEGENKGKVYDNYLCCYYFSDELRKEAQKEPKEKKPAKVKESTVNVDVTMADLGFEDEPVIPSPVEPVSEVAESPAA